MSTFVLDCSFTKGGHRAGPAHLAVGALHARCLELGAGLAVRLVVFVALRAPALQKEGIHAVKSAMVRGVTRPPIGASLTLELRPSAAFPSPPMA